MSRWFRHYAGMMRDDKLVRVAIRSKQSIERVVWVWGAILESAAEIDDAGRYDFDAAEAAYFLRTDETDILSIEAGLTDAGRVAAGCVVKWGDRQFKSDRSAARQADYRERQRKATGRSDGDQASPVTEGVTSLSRHGDAPETETEAETHPSPAKASEGKARKRAAPAPKPKFELPEWVPVPEWDAYVEMRRELERGPKKIPFTLGAAKAIVAELTKFREAGHDIAAILIKSTINSYRGVFAPDHPPAQAKAAHVPMSADDRAAYLAKLDASPHLRGLNTTDRPNGQSPPRGFGQLAAGIASQVTVQ